MAYVQTLVLTEEKKLDMDIICAFKTNFNV